MHGASSGDTTITQGDQIRYLIFGVGIVIDSESINFEESEKIILRIVKLVD